MAGYYWVAKDKDGTEAKYSRRPKLEDDYYVREDECSQVCYLPEGTIEKLIGHKPEWWDGPYEVDGDFYAPLGKEKYIEVRSELDNLKAMVNSDYCIGITNKPLASSIIRIDSIKPLLMQRIAEIEDVYGIMG